MLVEFVAALVVGAFVVWLVLTPMLRAGRGPGLAPEPLAEEETRRGMALLALKEIEFDRATGKLSDADYESMKERYGQEALQAMEAEPELPTAAEPIDPEQLIALRLRHLRAADASGAPAPPPCPTCGIRPEPDALFCSSCGLPLTTPECCASCGRKLEPESLFCADCGTRVAA